MTTPLLVTSHVRYHSSWLESFDEWDGEWMHGSSYFSAEAAGLDVTKPADFAAWVEDLLVQADPSVERPEGYVSATNRWIILDDVYCGAIQLRHRLTPGLTIMSGNIGYGIRPSYRRRGLASFALTSILP